METLTSWHAIFFSPCSTETPIHPCTGEPKALSLNSILLVYVINLKPGLHIQSKLRLLTKGYWAPCDPCHNILGLSRASSCYGRGSQFVADLDYGRELRPRGATKFYWVIDFGRGGACHKDLNHCRHYCGPPWLSL